MALGDIRQLVIVAAKARVLLVGFGMTDDAGHLLLAAMVQLKDVRLMQRRLPGRGGMAILAGTAYEPGMDGRIFVIGHAGHGRASEMLLGMAVLTLRLGVLTLQGVGLRMVELCNLVDTVVAGQAILVVSVYMRLHEISLMYCMALLAGGQIGMLHIDWVAALAGERLIVVGAGMMRQSEPDRGQGGVSERFAAQGGRRPSRCRVARITFLGKHPLVHGRLGMAPGTATRRSFQIVGGVALGAGN